MVASSATILHHGHPVSGRELMQQHGGHGCNLGQGIGLAEDAWG